jgi:predicted transcriptional regulator
MNVDLSSDELDRRRDRLHIMAEILQITLEGALKTQVMYKANLSFAQLNQYLSLLLNLKLLELKENSEKAIYKTTTKGMRFLEGYKQILELFKKTEETNGSNGNGSKNGNHSVFLVNRGNRVVCKETPQEN